MPADVVRDPFVLEFLDFDELPHWRERDLDQATIDRVEVRLPAPPQFLPIKRNPRKFVRVGRN